MLRGGVLSPGQIRYVLGRFHSSVQINFALKIPQQPCRESLHNQSYKATNQIVININGVLYLWLHDLLILLNRVYLKALKELHAEKNRGRK